MKYMTFDLKKMIHALHGITFKVRFPASKDKEIRRGAIRLSITASKHEVSIPATPCCEMIGGFIPKLLEWHCQCMNENSVPLTKYVESYYGEIPEYLQDEFKYFSDKDFKCIEYFPYIYQRVFLHQLETFRVSDKASLEAELAEHNLESEQ